VRNLLGKIRRCLQIANPAIPVKNIIPGQPVTKTKLQRAKELRREMTPADGKRSITTKI